MNRNSYITGSYEKMPYIEIPALIGHVFIEDYKASELIFNSERGRTKYPAINHGLCGLIRIFEMAWTVLDKDSTS